MISADVHEAMSSLAWSWLGAMGGLTGEVVEVPRAVEPESMLVLAALASAHDPRVGDVARDWLHTWKDLVSKPVLKRRVGLLAADELVIWEQFSARPSDGRLADRIAIDRGASVATLRYRAAFGVQARAGILQLLARHDDRSGWVIDAVARATGYSKATVRDAVDRLSEAGVLHIVRVGNLDRISLIEPDVVATLAGSPAVGTCDPDEPLRAFIAFRRCALALDASPGAVGTSTALAVLESPPDLAALSALRIMVPRPGTTVSETRAALEGMVRDAAARLADAERPSWPY